MDWTVVIKSATQDGKIKHLLFRIRIMARVAVTVDSVKFDTLLAIAMHILEH